MMIDLPIRAISASGDWGTNEVVVREWVIAGKSRNLIPLDYIEWLKSLHVNWVGLAVQLYYDDSLDSTVERVPSIPYTFSDEAVRQLIREFRGHGIDVYLTLALNDHAAVQSARPAPRWLLGLPYLPQNILPENWPWDPAHPDHERFVAEFWETYTQQAVHFARIAEDEGARLYSLGTETDLLFRTRSGDLNNPEQSHLPNHFGQDLKALWSVCGQCTAACYPTICIMTHSKYPDFYGQGSGAGYLWEDLDLDIVGISAWFPLLDTTPTTPISVETAQMKYEEIFSNFLKPLSQRNPNRPIMFLEYGAVDVVAYPQSTRLLRFLGVRIYRFEWQRAG